MFQCVGLLDGKGNGTSGSDCVALISRATPAGPASLAIPMDPRPQASRGARPADEIIPHPNGSKLADLVRWNIFTACARGVDIEREQASEEMRKCVVPCDKAS